jgi:hypothetical protein
MIHFQGYKQGSFEKTAVYMHAQNTHLFVNGDMIMGADAHQRNETALKPKKSLQGVVLKACNVVTRR